MRRVLGGKYIVFIGNSFLLVLLRHPLLLLLEKDIGFTGTPGGTKCHSILLKSLSLTMCPWQPSLSAILMLYLSFTVPHFCRGHWQGTYRHEWTWNWCHNIGTGQVCWGTCQHLNLGAAPATEESAFGLVKVEHSLQLVAGFVKTMRTIPLILNKGDEGVWTVRDPALLPFLGGSTGYPCLISLEEAREERNSLIRGRSEAKKCWECVSWSNVGETNVGETQPGVSLLSLSSVTACCYERWGIFKPEIKMQMTYLAPTSTQAGPEDEGN